MKDTFQINDFNLQYNSNDDGGGTSIGLDFKNILDIHYPNKTFNRCLEWCSGPGFIGFNLLLNNYCRELCLFDKHQSALDSATNSLSCYNSNFKVTTYCADKISSLPNTEKFDLVVANPPHFCASVFHQEEIFKNQPRIYLDHAWEIHKEFLENIHQYLNINGVILLQESSWGCNYDTFDDFLVNITRTNWYQTKSPIDTYPIFYIEYKLK